MNKRKLVRPIKGMDTDTSARLRDDKTAYLIKNLRINNEEPTFFGEYSNIKGGQKVIDNNGKQIIGIYQLQDSVLLFAGSKFSGDFIFRVSNDDISLDGSVVEINSSSYFWDGGNKVISGEFGFHQDKLPIVRVYYEDDSNQKVYWSVEGQPLRGLNIVRSDSNPIESYSPSDIEILPKSNLKEASISGLTSGSLDCGKIFYTYKVINGSGIESELAPFTYGYNLTKSNSNASNDFDYKGYGFDVDSGKGVILNISNVPINFNRIKVYSIHYIDDVSVPKIKLVYDNQITESATIVDNGIGIMEFTPEEFVLEHKYTIEGGVIEINNNRLFISNYTEPSFDIDEVNGSYWDARAYRFNSSLIAKLYTDDTYSAFDSITPSTITSVAENHNCINISNNINYFDETLSNNFIYIKDEVPDIGASGVNIEIIQVNTKTIHPDVSNQNAVWYSETKNDGNQLINTGVSSYANEEIASKYRTFIPNEVHRLAIQFENSKGEISYPKWICDYKVICDPDNTPPVSYSGDTGYSVDEVNSSILIYSLQFNVSNIPDDPYDSGIKLKWRILSVPFENADISAFWGFSIQLRRDYSRSIYSKVSMFYEYLLDFYPGSYVPSEYTDLYPSLKYAELIIPEYFFGIKANYSKLEQVLPVLQSSGNNYIQRIPSLDKMGLTKSYYFHNNREFYIKDVLSQKDISYSLNFDQKIALDDGDTYSRKMASPKMFDGYFEINGTNYARSMGGVNSGRFQIVNVDTSELNQRNLDGLICAYVDNIKSRFGGQSYYVRKSNKYTPISNFNSSQTIIYGTGYAGNFEALRGIVDPIGTNKYDIGAQDSIIFPTYCTFNLKLRSDTMMSEIIDANTTEYKNYLHHEYAGVYTDPTRGSDSPILTQETDLYLYNRTYSREQDLEVYYEKPIFGSLTDEFKTRIIASEKKILGQSSDSFMRLTGSYIDVDGRYGPIVSLFDFKNRLYFFQKNAFGIVAVNERSVIPDNNGQELALGTTELLSRYDYLSTENGIATDKSVTKSAENMYIIDATRKEFIRINNNGIEKISITGNINSLVKSCDLSTSTIVYNKRYNEIFFIVKEASRSHHSAIVFNERLNLFTGIYTYDRNIVNSMQSDIDTMVLFSDGDSYAINNGDYNRFQQGYLPSEITFIISSDNQQNVLFNEIEAIISQNDFVDTIRVYNDVYDTGELNFSEVTAFKFNKYRFNKMRGYINPGNKERILSDHIYITIRTKNNSYYNSTTNTTEALNSRINIKDLVVMFNDYNYL